MISIIYFSKWLTAPLLIMIKTMRLLKSKSLSPPWK